MKKALLAQKTRLKQLAQEIHNLRLTRKQCPHGVVPGLGALSYESRHRHIAYCLARGKSMEQIEKPREGNTPSKRSIEFYLKEIQQAAAADEPEQVSFVVTAEKLEIYNAVKVWSESNEREVVRAGEGGSVEDAKDSSILSRCSRALSALWGSVVK